MIYDKGKYIYSNDNYYDRDLWNTLNSYSFNGIRIEQFWGNYKICLSFCVYISLITPIKPCIFILALILLFSECSSNLMQTYWLRHFLLKTSQLVLHSTKSCNFLRWFFRVCNRIKIESKIINGLSSEAGLLYLIYL